MYEIIDTFPVIILRPLFGSDNWSTVIGLVNSALRLGSVACFIISPIIYRTSSVASAFAAAAVMAWVGFLCSLAGFMLEHCHTTTNLSTSRLSESVQSKHGMTTADSENDDDDDELDRSSHGNPMLDVIATNTFVPSPMKTVIDDNIQARGQVTRNSTDRTAYLKVNQGDDEAGDGDDAGSGLTQQDKHTESAKQAHTFTKQLLEWFPLNQLDFSFYMFALAAALMYGSMVPFWFTGSKFLQNHYLLNVREADALMLLPELEMVVFSPILGYCMDKYEISAKTRLRGLALSCLLLPASYIVLLNGYHSNTGGTGTISSTEEAIIIQPWIALITMGLGFVLSHGLIWFSIVLIFPMKYFEFCSGFVCSAINIFPTLIPPLVTSIFNRYGTGAGTDNSVWILWALIIAGSCASLAASLAAFNLISTANQGQGLDQEREIELAQM